MIASLVLLAKRSGSSPEEIVFGLMLVLGALAIVAIVASINGEAHYDVRTRNGAPYCPRCNRQVSYRRDHCRCCGYQFVSYGPSAEEVRIKHAEEQRRREDEAQEKLQKKRLAAESRKLREERRMLRQVEWDRYFLRRGIEPGPLAWYYVLPEWAQPILLGLALGIPIAGLLVLRHLFF